MPAQFISAAAIKTTNHRGDAGYHRNHQQLMAFVDCPVLDGVPAFFMGFVVADAGAKDYFASIVNHIVTLLKGNAP